MWEGFGDGFKKTLPQVAVAPYSVGHCPLTKINGPWFEGDEHNKLHPGRWAFLEVEAQQWGINPRPPLHGTPVKTVLLFISEGLRSAVFAATYSGGGIELHEGILR